MAVSTLVHLAGLLVYLALLALFALPAQEEVQRAVRPHAALSGFGVSPLVVPPSLKLKDGPDITVALLNWSRLPNVILIAASLCSPTLESLVSKILIWNNNPAINLTLHTFRSTGCPSHKLSFLNSPLNLYFAARFHACASVQTPYCFIQDDDYLIPPSALWALRLAAAERCEKRDIHMLPPAELLSTRLRHISSSDGRLHSSPAWLGYGTLILSERARAFLETFLTLEKDSFSIAMADNYYSILSNTEPELWFGQEIDLGMGQPFTVGSAGEERNWRYMELAKALLQAALSMLPEKARFADRSISFLPRSIWRTSCRRQLCLLETDIELLPEFPPLPAIQSLRETDLFRRKQLNREIKDLFTHFPLSNAVDGDEMTKFCTLLRPGASNYLMLDQFRTTFLPLNMLGDANSSIVDVGRKEFSVDGLDWTPATCQVQGDGRVCAARQSWRYFRLIIEADRLSGNLRALASQRSVRHLSVVQSLLHGSPEAKRAGDLELQQHSRLVARGKYVHAFEVHHIQPGRREEYKEAAEKFYTALAADENLKIKLTGGWEVSVGELDTFVHITEYENYAGYDRSTKLIADSEHEGRHQALLPIMASRSLQLNQEFAFLPSSPPQSKGGIFELRTYQLKPGALLEWEAAWRKGIEARRKFVEPVGAWFSHVGRLHQVHHLWQYPDLQTRKETRDAAWQLDGWADTVHKTAQLATTMDSSIMTALDYSPLK